MTVPDGVIKKDANQVMPESELFLIQNSYAAFSDLFRYRMIKNTGRAWVDADTICLSSNWNFKNNTFASLEESNTGSSVVGGVLGLPQNSEIVEYLVKESTLYDKSKITWSQVGPVLLDKAFKKFNYMNYTHPQETFCGIKVQEFEYLWNPDKLDYILSLEKISKSISVYNQMATKHKKDKNNFQKGSPLDYFYKKFVLNEKGL
jgi:hypothetical protein